MFGFWEVEGLFYLCSKSKGTDKLRLYNTADLQLCFRICNIRCSHDAAHIPLLHPVFGYKDKKQDFVI